MNLLLNHNRKLLQEQDPFHPTNYSPVPLINDSSSSSSSSTTADADGNKQQQPFKPNASPFDTSMALTILVLLTALFFMSFFSFYIRRYNNNNDNSNTNGRLISNNNDRPLRNSSTQRPSKGLDPDLIQSLPTISYGGDAKHRMECSICLTDFEETETVKLIPHCRHAFHPPCIDTWLATHVSCPLCRCTQLLFDEVRLSVGEVQVDVEEEESGSRMMMEVGSGGGVRRTCSYSGIIRDHFPLPRRSNSF